MKKILIANRGEIALRIIRAIQELGHTAVAIYETPDKEALHIRIADEAIWVGDGPRCDYLNIDKVVDACKKSGATAVHPGYGFLAENADFAEQAEKSGFKHFMLKEIHEQPRAVEDTVRGRISVETGDVRTSKLRPKDSA